jgi:type IV secretory pathway VirB2 component (pilin)
VSGAAELFLGVIALSVLVMAVIQVGAILAGLRLARRMEQVSRQIDEEIKPLLSNLTAVTSEAARTAALASRQVERVDVLFSDVTARVDEALATVRQVVGGPAKNGMAVLAGVQAAFSAFRGIREASRRRRNLRPGLDDEDSLFIG